MTATTNSGSCFEREIVYIAITQLITRLLCPILLCLFFVHYQMRFAYPDESVAGTRHVCMGYE
jgi:hypothetical protein